MSRVAITPARGGWSRTRLVVRALVAVLVATACVIGWMVYRGVHTSVEAEMNLHATILTIRVVDGFVREHGRWPHSWEELGSLSVPTLQEDGWPGRSSEIRQRVAVDFETDPRDVARQNPRAFTAIRPIGPYYEYRDYGHVAALQEAI